nr:hypothetical protein [Tanacetum cinerariifolium]
MCSDELYKFSDGTLTSIRIVLHDFASTLRMDYLPKRRWGNLDRQSQNQRDLSKDIPLVRIEVLRYDKKDKRYIEDFVSLKVKLVCMLHAYNNMGGHNVSAGYIHNTILRCRLPPPGQVRTYTPKSVSKSLKLLKKSTYIRTSRYRKGNIWFYQSLLIYLQKCQV